MRYGCTTFVAALWLIVGCGSGVPKEAALGPETQPAPGVTCREAAFDSEHRLWIYRPTNPGAGKLPCVVVAPAGSRLIHGMALTEEDRAEHIPYAQAGFVVVAYDLSGAIRGEDEASLRRSVTAYMRADAGIEDGKRAVDYVLANMPEVDPKKIATAGHSSAANQALMLAQNDSRIAACVAYAPSLGFLDELRQSNTLMKMDQAVPGLQSCIERNWPLDRRDDVKCPTFLFRAEDDYSTPQQPIEGFALAIKSRIPSSEYKVVQTGGHYDSMIREGIPAGIAFLRKVLQ